jgi:hypothetical protein
VQCREGQRRLRLQAASTQNTEVPEASGHRIEQGRLPDTRLTEHDERAGAAVSRVGQQPGKPAELGLPAVQHVRTLPGIPVI